MEDFLLALKPTFPDVQMNKSQVYPCTNLAVIETSYIMLEECACNQFHYIISMKQSPLVRMENKLHILKKKRFPMQSYAEPSNRRYGHYRFQGFYSLFRKYIS